MGVTIELQNLGDARVSREIVASIEHALSEKSGEWRVSIAGSIASENWEMRVEGPNGFERRILWRVLPGNTSQRQSGG